MIEVDGVEMVDIREAARIVGRTPETVRRWAWSGRVNAVKIGNRLLIPHAHISELSATVEAPQTGASLRQWADEVATGPHGAAGATAKDLVLAARAERP